MIVDYSEYITEKASKGIVNSVYVENGLPLFKHDSISVSYTHLTLPTKLEV